MTDTEREGSGRYFIVFVPLFICRRAYIPERRMSSLPIIKYLNVLEHIFSRLVSGSVSLAIDPLTLEAPKEALHAGIVPAVAFSAHTAHDLVIAKKLLHRI